MVERRAAGEECGRGVEARKGEATAENDGRPFPASDVDLFLPAPL